MGFRSTGTLKTGAAFWIQWIIRTALNETTYNSSLNVDKGSKTAGYTRPPSPTLRQFVLLQIRTAGFTLSKSYLNRVPWEGYSTMNTSVSLPSFSFPFSPNSFFPSSFSLSFLKWIFTYCKGGPGSWETAVILPGLLSSGLAPSPELPFTMDNILWMQICISDGFSPQQQQVCHDGISR